MPCALCRPVRCYNARVSEPEQKPIRASKHRWFQFSLRTFLVVVALIGIGLGVAVNRARSRKAAIVAIDNLGGTYAFFETGPQWLRNLVHDDKYFYDAARVTLGSTAAGYNFNRPFKDEDLDGMIDHLNVFSRFEQLDLSGSKVTDDGLRHLKGLRSLKILNLSNTAVSDEGLARLQGISTLRELELVRTKVTKAGVDELQRSLPTCTIRYK
jgi:hypothetical protein